MKNQEDIREPRSEAWPEFLGRPLESPLINAAGLINGPEERGVLRDVETLSGSAIGGITVGSWTLERRPGNAAEHGEPTHYYDPSNNELVNALGLPNVGIEAGGRMVGEILDIAGEKPVFFSVSPTAAEKGANPVEEAMELVDRLFQAGANIVELNVSCPNIVTDSGARKPLMGHDPASMEKLRQMLSCHPDSEIFARQLGVKLPPYLGVAELRIQHRVAEVLTDMPIAFLTVCNTIPGRRPVTDDKRPILTVPGGSGGGSGPTYWETGRLQLASWRAETSDTLPIISALGVCDGEEIAARRELGALAAAVNTELWMSDNWQRTVTKMLGEYADYCD